MEKNKNKKRFFQKFGKILEKKFDFFVEKM